MIYLAINGDDVGTSIGESIAADDHESVQATSGAVKDAHKMISQWVESHGGQEVTSSGDEGIYIIPEEATNELDDIRQSYQDTSGHSLTVGVGNSMSEASKALIFGKLSGKNQIVDYDPSIEDAISGDGGDDVVEDPESDDQVPSQDDLSEQAQSDIDEQNGVSSDPPHEQDMAPEEEMEHDAQEQEDDEQDSDVIEADQEADDEGLDGEVPLEDEEDMEDEGSQIEAEPVDSETSVYEDLSETDSEDEGEMSPEMEDEGFEDEGFEDEVPLEDEGESDDPLTDMVQSHMEGDEDEGMEDEMPPDGEGFEDPDAGGGDSNDQLKQDIANALVAFRNNKDMLEQAQDQNPELYEAVITMMRSMIDMGKLLGMSPMEDMEDQENQDQLDSEFPPADEGAEEPPPEELEPMPAGESEDEGDVGGEDEDEGFPGKKE